MDSHHTPATLQSPLQPSSSKQQPSTEPHLSRLLSHPSSTLLGYKRICVTGKLLPPNQAVDEASGPVLHRDPGKPFRPELRLEGEDGGEDSLGTQC